MRSAQRRNKRAVAASICGLLAMTVLMACSPGPPAPLGLPTVPIPADNPPTAEKIALGRKLFFDRRLSANGTMSCAMCHLPEQGFTANELATALGVEGRSLRRNAPTLLNVAYQPRLFHDGRESSLERQIWGPLLNPDEMANPSVGDVIEKIRVLDDYPQRFAAAFGRRGLTAETIAQAIAAYERTLVAGDSAFDRWRYGARADALTPEAQAGFDLFMGRARCVSCHLVGERDAPFTDYGFHNTGIGWRRTYDASPSVRVQLAPGVFTEVDRHTIDAMFEAQQLDLGRFEITRDPADRWAYRTPSLRNVALTAPYMHDGSLATLADVVAFYDAGGSGDPGRSPLIAPLGLTTEEKRALVAFLESLTGSNAGMLAQAARAR